MQVLMQQTVYPALVLVVDCEMVEYVVEL